MYAGVDVGGTKTLLAVLNENGEIKEEAKFPTPKNYDEFLFELKKAAVQFKHQRFKAAGAGIPTTVFDRKSGVAKRFGNLPWRDVSIGPDLEKLFSCPVVVENDAKMAALSESMLLKDKYSRVAYVTVSTGIGYGLVNDGAIDISVGDGGGRTILLEHKGKMTPWEDFAGGRAIVEIYGKRAEAIEDEKTWREISHNLSRGLIELIAIMQPEVIVIGGSVGVYFHRFGKLLKQELEKYEVPLLKMPHLVQAQRPERAVVYGCYDLAKQVYGDG